MPKDPLVSSNYAKALLHAFKKNGTNLHEALTEAEDLRRLIAGEPRLRVFLEGPQFREEDKERVIGNAFKGRISALLFQFLILLLRRNRIEHLFEIIDEFEFLVELEEGVTPGVVHSAVPMNDDERQRLQDKLEAVTGRKFDLKFKVNPQLIGGVKVQYKDILFDSSIQTYLNDLRQRLMKTRLAS